MNKRETNGITLIALVITIIILIILAGIGLNLVMGENGIIHRAKSSKKLQDIGRISEKLELEKDDLYIKEQGTLEFDKYLEQIQEKEIITEDDIVINHEESVNITVEDEYVFLVEKEENGNIKIEYLGEPSDLTPRIEIKNVSNTSHSVTVEFELRYALKYKVSIRNEKQEIKEEIEEKVNSRIISHTFENLEQSQNYIIKIEAETEKGIKAEKEQSVTTKTIESLTTSNCTFSYNPNDWTNQTVTATATVSIDIGEYTLQTSKDGIDWQNTASQTLETNGPVYARLIDSTEQEGGSTTGNVDKIDKQKPAVTNETTATTNTITIKATDEASGIIGYTVTENTTQPEDFTEYTNTKNLSVDVGNKAQGKTYYVWVKDKAGNISEYKKITMVNIPTPSITIASENNWTISGKSVTLSKINGYTTKYTTDGSEPSATNGTTYSNTFIISANNTTVKAVYVDSINQVGEVANKTVKNIDLEDPSATITISGSTTQSTLPVTLTAKVTNTDATSGVKISSCKYILNTSSTELGTTESSYTDGTFSSSEQSITIQPNSATSWYLHVLTVDNAGRAKETIKGPIEITANYHTHSGSSTSGGGCYTVPIYHSHTDSCYTEIRCTGRLGCIELDGQYFWRCDKCDDTGFSSSNVAYQVHNKVIGRELTCGKTTSTVIQYNLGCGKTTDQIVSYAISY